MTAAELGEALRWAAKVLQTVRGEHGCEDEGLRRAISELEVRAHEAACLGSQEVSLVWPIDPTAHAKVMDELEAKR